MWTDLTCSPLYAKHQVQHLAHRRCSKDIYGSKVEEAGGKDFLGGWRKEQERKMEGNEKQTDARVLGTADVTGNKTGWRGSLPCLAGAQLVRGAYQERGSQSG